MAGFPVGGANGMKQADVSALLGHLRKSSGPANPATPNSRQDPSDERLTALAQLRKALELVDRTVPDDDPILKALISKMRTVAVRLLQGEDPQAIVQGIAASLGGGMTPPSSQQAPPPSAPMGPTAGPMPEPPMGGPPTPGPVSPGSLPG